MNALNKVAIHVLVANASEAKCYKTMHLGEELSLVKEYGHSESRQKSSDLVSDGPGHYKTDGSAHGAYVSHSTPHELEADVFARKLSHALEIARNNNEYEQLIIIAPPHFHGLLNKHCNEQVRLCVIHNIEKDYTKLTEKELLMHLRQLKKHV